MKHIINFIFGMLMGFSLIMLNLPDYKYILIVKLIGILFIAWTFYYSFSNMKQKDAKPKQGVKE